MKDNVFIYNYCPYDVRVGTELFRSELDGPGVSNSMLSAALTTLLGVNVYLSIKTEPRELPCPHNDTLLIVEERIAREYVGRRDLVVPYGGAGMVDGVREAESLLVAWYGVMRVETESE